MVENKNISIVLADDHLIVRQGLRALLEAEEDLKVIGETGDGLKAVDMVRKLNPDVAVLDLMMPGLNGIDVARQLSKQTPHIKLIILTMYDDEGFVLEALSNGVSGYVLKDAGSADLIHAVREVKGGHRYLSPSLSDRAIDTYENMNRAGTTDKYETLTAREREVLHLSAEGLTSNRIAIRLGISVRTAETHRSNVMHKLDIHTQADLTRYAIRRGIISAG
ncbi:MAG: response regulator transcription factor [Acidobacteriota bacterium]